MQIHSRHNLDETWMQFSFNEDSFMEEAEDEVAMFTNFMGGRLVGWVVWRS